MDGYRLRGASRGEKEGIYGGFEFEPFGSSTIYIITKTKNQSTNIIILENKKGGPCG